MAVYTEGKDVEKGSEEWTDADPRSGVRSGCREDHTHYIDARMGGLLHHECGYRNDGSYLLTARFMGVGSSLGAANYICACPVLVSNLALWMRSTSPRCGFGIGDLFQIQIISAVA